MATEDEARWATIDEVAERLRVGRDTVRKMIRNGEIDGRRFGKRIIRVDLNTLDASGKSLAA